MKFGKVLIVAGAFLLAPAAWLLLSGLYVGLVAPGSERSKAEARLVLWRDVLRAKSRRWELVGLRPGPQRAQSGPMPVYVYNLPPPKRLSEVLPTCPDHVIEAEKPKSEWVFRAGTRPSLFPLRATLEEDVAYVAHANRLSIPELALLHACFRTTPFGARCDAWMVREEPTRSEILAGLVQRGWVGRQSGRYCWQLPEFRFRG